MPSTPVCSLEIPILETPRLRLRGHRQEDFPNSCTLWADPTVVRYTVGQAQTPEEVWSRMLRYLGLWSMLGFGYWVVEERATNSFVGEVGLCAAPSLLRWRTCPRSAGPCSPRITAKATPPKPRRPH